MKNNDKLTHQEVVDTLTFCLRELMANEISHRNMPNLINRGKAAAGLVTALHREEIMESKRQSAQKLLSDSINKTISK